MGENKKINFIFRKAYYLLLLILLFSCQYEQHRDFNIIMISLDTTRFDYIDSGKGALAKTPALKKFAKDSIVFENAFCTCPETLPSHLSVFTSRMPHELKVFNNSDIYEGSYKMIHQVLRRKGFHTSAIISLGTLDSETGIKPGFIDFDDNLFEKEIFFVPAEKVTERAIKKINNFKSRNFFLFIHYSDPHTPYAPPEAEALFEIHLDGKRMADFNAYTGAILRKKISLARGSHLMEFRVRNHFEDFTHFILRRLRFSKECTVRSNTLQKKDSGYRDAYHLNDDQGRIQIDCDKEGYIELFQVIPILNQNSALKLYRQEVEYMDQSLGELFRHIEKHNRFSKTVIVVFGDHGEGHGEKDGFFGHTKYVNRQFIQVPLIMRIPNMGNKRFEYPVSLDCLSPTLLEYLKIHSQSIPWKKSILNEIKEKKINKKNICSFAFKPSARFNTLSLIRWPFQGVVYWDKGEVKRWEFFNLKKSKAFNEQDVVDREDLSRYSEDMYARLMRDIKEMREEISLSFGTKKEPSEKILEKMKTLGYVGK